jgi:tRNA-5-taurinomethyluridine 2-sulfurtransferase
MKPGPFVDIDTGQTVDEHNGIHNWTVGQRIHKGGCIKPYFVLKKDMYSNTIYVSAGTDHPTLFTDLFYTDLPYWINRPDFRKFIFNCEFRFQHTKPLTKAKIFQTNEGRLFVKLAKHLRAITPGQYAVFYNGDECLGSARILQPGPSLKYAIPQIS